MLERDVHAPAGRGPRRAVRAPARTARRWSARRWGRSRSRTADEERLLPLSEALPFLPEYPLTGARLTTCGTAARSKTPAGRGRGIGRAVDPGGRARRRVRAPRRRIEARNRPPLKGARFFGCATPIKRLTLGGDGLRWARATGVRDGDVGMCAVVRVSGRRPCRADWRVQRAADRREALVRRLYGGRRRARVRDVGRAAADPDPRHRALPARRGAAHAFLRDEFYCDRVRLDALSARPGSLPQLALRIGHDRARRSPAHRHAVLGRHPPVPRAGAARERWRRSSCS